MNILQKMIVVAVLVGVQAYAFSASASLGSMRISFIENELQIKTPEAGEWGYGAINTPLDVGDELWVPQGGRAELQLNTGSYIRLDGGTALQILSMDQDSSQMYLSLGRANIYYDAPRDSVIQIDTPDASTRAFDRATFSLSLSAQTTEVAVYKGYVLTENRVGEIRVNAGNMVSLGLDTNGEIASIGYLDEWEEWNQARDEQLYGARTSESVRYLPSELRTYSSDLDSHGRWVQVNDYGYVWTPRTHIDRGWTPYRHGRWIWRHGDYIWLPYEPWGWVPYHYGRWAFVGGIGWCWVPPLPGAVYWGPGYVGWVRTLDYVGWVPLAPGEIYYGRGYYGRNSVNITNININEINITNVYQNVTVSNGPVIVGQNAFLSGSHDAVLVDTNIRDRAFTRKNMIPGSPDIKPAKKSLFAVDREIPKDKVPPRHVGMQPATELQKVRPVTKEPRHSVFNPGATPANLPMEKTDRERIKGKEKPILEKGRPVQRPLPGGPGRSPEDKPGSEQPLLDRPGKSMGPAEERRGVIEKIKEPRPVRRDPPERRPQSGGPGKPAVDKAGAEQPLPDRPGKSMGPAEERREVIEKVKQPQPVQPQLEQKSRPKGTEGRGKVQREQKQVQPAQPVKPPVQGPPVKPKKGGGTKESEEQELLEDSQYWPGQKVQKK